MSVEWLGEDGCEVFTIRRCKAWKKLKTCGSQIKRLRF